MSLSCWTSLGWRKGGAARPHGSALPPYAGHHIARSTDFKTIQETLGHASLETTARYIALAK